MAAKKLDPATQRQLLERLARDAERIAKPFGLRYRAIVAERAGVKRRYGACFDDGTIKIRLVNVVSGKPLRYESLLDTLCHELAHLKYWHHGPTFQRFHRRLLGYAKEHGIGQDAPRRSRSAARATPAGEESGTETHAGDRRPTRREGDRPKEPPAGQPAIPAVRPEGQTRARAGKRKPEQLSLFTP